MTAKTITASRGGFAGRAQPFAPKSCHMSRGYSAFKWMIVGNIAATVVFAVGLGVFMVADLSGPHLLFVLPYLIFPVVAFLPPDSFVYGFCHPTAYDEPPGATRKIGVGVFWCLTAIPAAGAILMMLWLLRFFPGFGAALAILLVVVMAPFLFVAACTLDVHHAGFAEVASFLRDGSDQGKLLRRLIPHAATDIALKGSLGGGLLPGVQNAQFVCTVPEEDFLAFAREHGYVLSGNGTTCDAHPPPANSPPVRCDWSGSLRFLGGKLPASFWSYADIPPGAGGARLLYDRAAHRLYGSYMSD